MPATASDAFSIVVKHAPPLRETSCKSRKSLYLLLSLLPWPLLVAQRKKKLRLPKLLLPKLLLRLLKLLLLKPLLLLLKPPLLLLKLLLLPLKLLLRLLPSNQTPFGLMQKGVPRHPFFIARDYPNPHRQ